MMAARPLELLCGLLKGVEQCHGESNL